MKNINLLFLLIGFLALNACKKETEVLKTPQVDNYIYEIGGESVYASNVEKTKQKSPEQFLSILHANLFQSTISQGDLADFAEIRKAIGDKQLADELTLNSFVNDGGVTIPTDAEMRNDVEGFIKATYLRFFLREPTAYEVFELKEAIEEDAGLSPDLIYQSFALSNEYKFY